MKKISNVVVLLVIVLGIHTPCSANPLSNIMSFFQRDLVIEVIYSNPKDLIQGSGVYLAADPGDTKILIGKVSQVSLVDSQMCRVKIKIDKKYKEKIFATTPFVLMSNVFSEKSDAFIVAVSSPESSDKKPLKSGSSVKGVTYLEYKMTAAGEQLKKIMDRLKKQNNEMVNQLEEYIDTFDTEAFHKKMDDLADQISQFSSKQKESFKNEVLPSLRKMFDSMKKKLQEQNNMKKSKELENQLNKIEDLIDV